MSINTNKHATKTYFEEIIKNMITKLFNQQYSLTQNHSISEIFFSRFHFRILGITPLPPTVQP